jgi:hypothetical protein
VATPLERNASSWRVRIAFFLLFVFLGVGTYLAIYLRNLQERTAARDTQAALQEITDPQQIDEALKRHPSDKVLQMIARATKAAEETSVAAEKLSNDIEPPSLSKTINFATVTRGNLESLRSDLRAAEANATAFMPRYVALLKVERGVVEQSASSLNVGKDYVSRFLESIDKRYAETTDFNNRMLSARADYYHAYENYVAVLIGEFGAYKVVNGELIFPFQRTMDRYNVAARAMTAAARRIDELEDERKKLVQSQQERWEQFVSGK